MKWTPVKLAAWLGISYRSRVDRAASETLSVTVVRGEAARLALVNILGDDGRVGAVAFAVLLYQSHRPTGETSRGR